MTIKTWGLVFVAFTGVIFAQTINQDKGMKMVASGKDAVLDYLANDARQQTHGKNGVYALYTDDAGDDSLLIIDGHIFRGRQGAGSFPGSLDDLRGVPPNENFIFGGHIVTEIETVDKK